MIDKSQIMRFTSNYPNLQGLKSIPISLWLLILTVWANQQQGEARNLTLPLLVSLTMIIFYWFVLQYYRLSFGEIKQSASKRGNEILISILAGILALVVFYFDTAADLPISLIGIFWSGLLVFDGNRIQRSLPGKTFAFYWIFAAFLLLVSIFPLLGWMEWWLKFGFQNQLYAVLVSASIVMFLGGVLWHFLLLRNMEIKG